MILKSDINSEFVYIILEGISQFSLLNNFGDKLTKDQTKRFRNMEYKVGKKGDTTVKLYKFIIEEKAVISERTKNNVPSTMFQIEVDGVETKTVNLKEMATEAEITYYRLYEFSKLYEYNNLSMKLLEKSLSPILNTE